MLTKFKSSFSAFVRNETSGATLLLAATIVALLWANLGGHSYEHFWHTHFSIHLGDVFSVDMSLQHWINDGLMMMFFFLVSLEVKHDFVMGELREWRRASVPVVAAVAGLIVPALIFYAFNAGTDDADAWGVVISTDTAFVMGILAVFGNRLPVQLRAFLVTLAVVDDVGSLLVIATVYTERISFVPLIGVVVIAALLFLVQRARVYRSSVYIAAGATLWLLFLASGVHATIAGVVLGLLLPVFPPERSEVLRAEELTHHFRRTPVASTGSAAVIGILRSVSINERMQLALAPIVNLIVVPVFALSNAGVIISGETLQHAFKSPLTWGIIAGLVGGKYLGVFGASIIATKLRIGELAQCLAYRHINAGSMLTGIGFTISLFIIDLAIKDETAQSDARIGVLTASILAAIIGMVALALTAAYDARHAPECTRLNRSIDPKRDHILGDPNAPLTLVEYAQLGGVDDTTVEEVVREVRDYFGDDLRFVFRHNPMGDEAAERAAEALEAVHAQSPELFNYARTELSRLCEEEELDSRVIRRAAVDVGSNLPRLEKDMRQRTYLSRVHDDADDALGMGLTSTPTFFIGDEIYEGPIESNAIIAALEATRTAEITTVGV
ncbi:Na+/H+ antiporter NhaA [Corynebacterium durum]|uniref:Na+/H+ antiporter NhaA n=1 Tax=Corynebacterium durum TaxID=61592 RepID=UPI00288C5025|nr:Na+/H+ antiporter NhaA [Corynebacterium durum]